MLWAEVEAWQGSRWLLICSTLRESITSAEFWCDYKLGCYAVRPAQSARKSDAHHTSEVRPRTPHATISAAGFLQSCYAQIRAGNGLASLGMSANVKHMTTDRSCRITSQSNCMCLYCLVGRQVAVMLLLPLLPQSLAVCLVGGPVPVPTVLAAVPYCPTPATLLHPATSE